MAGWKDVAVPKPYPREFRDDVMRVARDREAGVTVEQIAKDFGVHPMTLFKWLRQADIDAGTTPGTASSESAVEDCSPALLPVAGPTSHDHRAGGGASGQRVVRRSP
ncbi:transposase [Micromonospora coerulea]|uniref:transposase n=1 Tax=Micromonospora coerulea TaxID=47856 RepID=UPI0027DE144C|nr:transposase [Micromonospora veneta]